MNSGERRPLVYRILDMIKEPEKDSTMRKVNKAKEEKKRQLETSGSYVENYLIKKSILT